MRLLFGITTYGRSVPYRYTLARIREACKGHRATVVVLQDGGRHYVEDLSWGENFRVLTLWQSRRGKTEYWKTINNLFSVCSAQPFDLYVQLPDDLLYEEGWLEKALTYMDRLPMDAAVNLLACHRTFRGTWGFKPRNFRRGLLAHGFIDGAFIATRSAMQSIAWRIDPVPLSRWEKNPLLGSGVWSQVTKRMHRRGIHIYNMTEQVLRTEWSAHKSKMNPNRPHDEAHGKPNP